MLLISEILDQVISYPEKYRDIIDAAKNTADRLFRENATKLVLGSNLEKQNLAEEIRRALKKHNLYNEEFEKETVIFDSFVRPLIKRIFGSQN